MVTRFGNLENLCWRRFKAQMKTLSHFLQIVGGLAGPESSGSDFRVSRKTVVYTKASSIQGKDAFSVAKLPVCLSEPAESDAKANNPPTPLLKKEHIWSWLFSSYSSSCRTNQIQSRQAYRLILHYTSVMDWETERCLKVHHDSLALGGGGVNERLHEVCS